MIQCAIRSRLKGNVVLNIFSSLQADKERDEVSHTPDAGAF